MTGIRIIDNELVFGYIKKFKLWLGASGTIAGLNGTINSKISVRLVANAAFGVCVVRQCCKSGLPGGSSTSTG
jgi:hypothetical protein